ncbi:MAG: CHAT domain-containing protein [Leptolyngbyaceae cyanobacterium]
MKKCFIVSEHRYLRFLLSGFLSFLVAVNIPALAAYSSVGSSRSIPLELGHSFVQKKVQATPTPEFQLWGSLAVTLDDEISLEHSLLHIKEQAAAAQSTTSLLRKGIELYRAEQFSAAVDSWNQALATSAVKDLNQALVFNNLSLGYQHLGQLAQADEAITQARFILDGLADTSNSVTYWEIAGKVLNTQGRLHWIRGEIEAASGIWREATAAYQQAGYERGIILSLINQAKALQTLGLHLQSKKILQEDVYQRLENANLDPILQATSLWQLGNAQRQFGLIKESKTYLQKSLDIVANNQQIEYLRAPILLDIGNTARALGNRAKALGKTDEADTYQTAALQAYKKAAGSSSIEMTQLQANLNQLSLLIGIENWTEADILWPKLLSELNLPLSRSAIYAQLNFANSLTQLMAMGGGQQPTQQEIDEILKATVQQSDSLNDPIAKSYALGQRGKLYETTEQWLLAEEFTQKALQLTTTNDYPDGLYRWQWQQGRLLRKQHKRDEAIAAYDAAVRTLKGIRNNLRFIDAEVQFSFRDNVEPIYRQFVELLLIREDNQRPKDAVLDKAIQEIDSLQLSELENFLRCSLAQTTPITKFAVDPSTAVLYPMVLENHLTVILQLPDGKRFHEVKIPRKQSEQILGDLRENLSGSPSKTPAVVPLAEEVYDWLIQPFIDDLEKYEQIDTLVFVLDGALRNIPMGVLYDGNQFLIEKYAIAVAPELKLFEPQPISDNFKVFTGGVGEEQTLGGQRFETIEKLSAELDAVSDLFGPQPPLINQEFKGHILQEELSTGNFSGIHLKTHGVFSSEPEETFIVAYEELLQGDELGALIQTGSGQGVTPIELLVLSACSTATGDDRAVLGLAGITVRAGARSTISTLWQAQDEPNTLLMTRFYEELKQPGITRAKALRNAQLYLIREEGYRPPYVWATYVLVGNWL